MWHSYYSLLQDKVKDAKTARHDLRHHFVVISGFVENKRYDQLADYLNQYRRVSVDAEPISYCSNEVSDILAHHYSRLSKEHGIRLSLSLDVGSDIKVADADLNALFSNLLENAVEACLRLPENKRAINFSAGQRQSVLAIRMENSSAVPEQKGDVLLSSKGKGRTGYGLEIIKTIAQRYNGAADFWYDEQTARFVSIVTLETK